MPAAVRGTLRVLGFVAFGFAGVLLVGCGSSGSRGGRQVAAAPSASTTSIASARPAVAVKLMHTQYGSVLVDGNGRALYLFTRDRTPSSRCYGACAGNWPPFLTPGKPVAFTGSQGTLLGTTARAGGSTQVTYAGHPLYYYVGDHRPGEVLCQGVEEFGGTWYVLTRRGSAVL
jgi:predicted lipoprotein with Yx(FWY)xxD motif